MNTTVSKARRAAAWTPLRRLTDRIRPQYLPGRHHAVWSAA